MKKIGTLCMAAALLLVACNDSDNDYPRQAAFVTAHLGDTAAPSAAESTAAAGFYFTDDAGTRLLPADRSRVPGYLPVEGDRAVISFNILESSTGGYDYDIALYEVAPVKVGATGSATTADEAAAYGTAQTSIGSVVQTTSAWFNMMVGYSGTDPAKHRFTLVRNLAPEATQGSPLYYPDESEVDRNDPDYLFLELHHDAAGDATGYEIAEWLSVPLDGFAAELEGRKGIIVAVPTRANGVRCIYYRFPEGQ